jgi:hypothetical protein
LVRGYFLYFFGVYFFGAGLLLGNFCGVAFLWCGA